ncbi:unnamed protein product [Prorocentrum cordatum]|uniref:Cyclic nucleotide-binding domain-containing protein n=1 Tax=Prorocentrum cordatum TaxID=2364126 RepID=A0ABN9THB9_9DINO|nr:unnamed protein product [Polarella glacialis]
MAAREPEGAQAFEAHLRALTAALDLQASLVRSALDLHPASPLVDFKGLANEAVTKFSVAIGDFRSDLIAVAAKPADDGEPPKVAVAEAVPDVAPPDAAPTGSTTMAAGTTTSADPEPRRPSHGSRRSSAMQSKGFSHSMLSREDAEQLAVYGSAGSRSRSQSQGSDAVVGVDNDFPLGDLDTSFNDARNRGESSCCIDGVIHPDSPPRLAWDLVIIVLVLCDSVVIPFQLAEFSTELGFDDVWLWLLVCIFVCDLVANFFTGYPAGKNDKLRQEGTIITNKASIASHYLRGWFWIDFLSTVPWSVCVDAMWSDGKSDTSSAGQVTKLAKIVKLTRLLRLVRMLRLVKLSVIWERLEGQIGSITALNMVVLVKALAIWTVICHWGACAWWMVGTRNSLVMLLTFQDDDPEALHWTELPRVHSSRDDMQWKWVERPASEQYVFCFYWILGVMRTMPAEVTPVNLSERMFVLLFMFFAVMAFAINVARITQAWFKFSARRDAFKEEMAYVRMNLRAIDCGSTLQKRSQAYLNYLFEKRKIHAKELSLMNTLPEKLKKQLSQAHRIRYLRLVPRLQEWSVPVLRRVCDATETVDYLPGDKITERYNDAEAAFVLMRGGIHVYNPQDHPQLDRGRSGLSDGSLGSLASVLRHLQLSSRRRTHLTILDDHCLCDLGDTALSKNTVVALECSEVLRIDRQRFHDVLLELSLDQTQIMQMSGGPKRSSENGAQAQQDRGTDRVVRRSSIMQYFVAGQVSV